MVIFILRNDFQDISWESIKTDKIGAYCQEDQCETIHIKMCQVWALHINMSSVTKCTCKCSNTLRVVCCRGAAAQWINEQSDKKKKGL